MQDASELPSCRSLENETHETDGSLRLSQAGASLANDCRCGSNRSAHDVRDQVC